jgi:cytochrome c-type biogenesis protein CcmF
MTLAVPAIASGVTGDVYVTVLEVAQDNSSVTLRLATNPAVGWIWGAGGLLALAGVLAALPHGLRRLRLAPRPRAPLPEERVPPAPTLEERV